jgi:phosphatidylinositol-3-phosphatase
MTLARFSRIIGLAGGLLVALGSCGSSEPPRATASSTAPPTTTAVPLISAASKSPDPDGSVRHVFVLVLENHSYGQIIGSPDAPYLNRLVRRYTLATRYYAITHPSLPNYIAMIGGSTLGIRSNCTDCSVDASNLADQLERQRFSWRGYFESMPSPCYKGGSAGRYGKKHDPFMYFDDIHTNSTRCRQHVVPLPALSRDLSRGVVPNFSLIVPDGCHDMHDCSVAVGDRWLRGFIPKILGSRGFGSGGVLVITFDEDNGAARNHIATIVVNPRARPGTRSSARFDHYSLLRGIEDVFGLGHLRHAGDPGRLSLAPLLR